MGWQFEETRVEGDIDAFMAAYEAGEMYLHWRQKRMQALEMFRHDSAWIDRSLAAIARVYGDRRETYEPFDPR